MMRHLNYALYSLIAWLLVFGTACETTPNFRCVEGGGARITESREVEGFQHIHLDADADVYLKQGSQFELMITAQNNILKEITTEVSGEVLRIANERCLRQEKTIRIDITLPVLAGLEVNGSGDVYGETPFTTNAMNLFIKGSGGIELDATTDEMVIELGGSGNATLNLQTGTIDSKVKGSGDLHLFGSASTHNSIVNGTGGLRAFDFSTAQTDLAMKGLGDARVQADSLLNIEILGSGDVYYKGRPALNVKISGTGEVKDAN